MVDSSDLSRSIARLKLTLAQMAAITAAPIWMAGCDQGRR
jgi:hypothetical protein